MATTTWRSRPNRPDDAAPALPSFWFEELSGHRHYPFEQPKGSDEEPITITLHGDGLIAPIQPTIEALQAFHTRGVDLCLAGEPPDSLELRPDLDSAELDEGIQKGPLNSESRLLRLGDLLTSASAWIPDDQYLRSKFGVSDEPVARRIRAAWPWLSVHQALNRDAFVTLDADLLSVRYEVADVAKAWILSPSEALDFIDARLRGSEEYRLAAFTHTDRWSYYDLRIRDLIPVILELYGVLAKRDGNQEAVALAGSLINRLRFLLEAHLRIGEYYYRPTNRDTNDAALYHLNFFMVLSTSIFDNLAWIIKELYEIAVGRQGISLRRPVRKDRKTLRTELAIIDPTLDGLLGKRDPLAELLYPARHNVAHRLLMWAIGYSDEHTGTGVALAEIECDFADAVRLMDDQPGLFYSRWGLRTMSDTTVIEPYRFTRQALLEIVSLVTDVALHVGEKIANRSFKEAPEQRDHWLHFTIPFPQEIV